MLSAEALDFIQFDVRLLRLRHGAARDPPVGARQAGGQIGPGSGLSVLPGAARMGSNFAVCGLPEPDKARLFAEDDGVEPPPDHHLSAVRRGRDGYQVAGRDPLRPRRGEGRRVSNRRKLSRPENLTRIFLNMQHDPATQQCGSMTSIRRSNHPPSVS